MLGWAERDRRQYSTGDYCESPDSAAKPLGFTGQPHRHRLHSFPRCLKKQQRCPAACYHQPKAAHTIPNRRMHRPGVRKMRRMQHQLEESTSMDEHKSITSYSSILTVDVSREMEAVNRDIEEIIRRCDDYCLETPASMCKHCWRARHCKPNKVARCLPDDQSRMLSLRRIPVERLKEVPLSLLKPRPPRQFKEKSQSAPHAKFKTSRDIRDIVEETDALLRNVYLELSRGKPPPDDDMEQPIWGHTCFQRYLGCQNKCRRLHENRWFKPKWKELFEKADLYKMIRPNDQRGKHFHDTNCISEPVSSCVIPNGRQEAEPKSTTETGVNTDEIRVTEPVENKNDGHSWEFPNRNTYRNDFKDKPFDDEKKYQPDSGSVNLFYNSDVSGKTSPFKSSNSHSFDLKNSKDESSLLLDRNMGLSLDRPPKILSNEGKTDSGVFSSNKIVEPASKTPDTFVSHDYLAGSPRVSPRSGAGDSVSALESSKVLISQIISKIVNKPLEFSPPAILQTVDVGGYEKAEPGDCDDLDTGMCLEIMRRLVDLMTNHHRKQIFTMKDAPCQYVRVRKMKHQHLVNIDKEINSILDLEFYLRNVSPTRT